MWMVWNEVDGGEWCGWCGMKWDDGVECVATTSILPAFFKLSQSSPIWVQKAEKRKVGEGVRVGCGFKPLHSSLFAWLLSPATICPPRSQRPADLAVVTSWLPGSCATIENFWDACFCANVEETSRARLSTCKCITWRRLARPYINLLVQRLSVCSAEHACLHVLVLLVFVH